MLLVIALLLSDPFDLGALTLSTPALMTVSQAYIQAMGVQKAIVLPYRSVLVLTDLHRVGMRNSRPYGSYYMKKVVLLASDNLN